MLYFLYLLIQPFLLHSAHLHILVDILFLLVLRLKLVSFRYSPYSYDCIVIENSRNQLQKKVKRRLLPWSTCHSSLKPSRIRKIFSRQVSKYQEEVQASGLKFYFGNHNKVMLLVIDSIVFALEFWHRKYYPVHSLFVLIFLLFLNDSFIHVWTSGSLDLRNHLNFRQVFCRLLISYLLLLLLDRQTLVHKEAWNQLLRGEILDRRNRGGKLLHLINFL